LFVVPVVFVLGLVIELVFIRPLRPSEREELSLLVTWAVALGYALHAFIGWRAALEDLFAGVKPRWLLLSRAIFDRSFAPQLEADP